jgi:hypothetical protein
MILGVYFDEASMILLGCFVVCLRDTPSVSKKPTKTQP